MRITEIRDATVSFGAAIRNAGIAYDAMTGSAVVIEATRKSGAPLVGLGLDSIGRYSHGALMRERFVPRLLAADPDQLLDDDGLIDPEAAWAVMMTNEKPGGHGERAGAVGVLDMALWDLRAKQRGEPAWRTIADYYGCAPEPAVRLYATGGHYADDPADTGPMMAALQASRDGGHRRFKIKIGGAPADIDCRRIEAAMAVAGTGNLAVDANGVWSPEEADDWFRKLAAFDLAWVEEPVAPLDFSGLATVARTHAMPVGTAENLFSWDDARNLLRHGGLRPSVDWLQFDVSLSYGLPEFVRIVDLCVEHGWLRGRFAPHAGHFLALHAVAGLRLGMAECAMDQSLAIAALPDGAIVDDGVMTLGEQPGFGLESTPPLHACFEDTVLA